MIIKSSSFIVSNTDYKKCPQSPLPEFAFIGRSNVGKSSLINMIIGRKSLAKTSTRPGKTQTINHFLINESWHLVDLPGYGYTSAGKTARYAWGKMIEGYLSYRANLLYTFILLDSRLKPQAIDLDFIEWAGRMRIPIALVLTKTDKLSRTSLDQSIEKYKESLFALWEELPPLFVTSSQTSTGKKELLHFMKEAMKSVT